VDRFSITFVCTGNRFRSVLAEAFVHQLTVGLPVSTQSFGALPIEGARPLPQALEIAVACGVSISDHRTRYLNDSSLGDADLVLGFELAHVRQAVVDANARRGHTFMMDEFVALLPPHRPGEPTEGVVSRARGLVAAVAERAPGLTDPHSKGIRDPLGRSWKVYRDTAVEVRELSLMLAARLFGVTDGGVLLPVPSKLRRRSALRRRLRLG
jgi:protein-tyrosine phosphatase